LRRCPRALENRAQQLSPTPMRNCSQSLDTSKNFNAHLLRLRYIMSSIFFGKFPLDFFKRCSVSRSALLDSCPQLRQSRPFRS
jgi:hypothetical protein